MNGLEHHAHCCPFQADEIDHLRAELAKVIELRTKDNGLWVARAEQAEARLAAVIALCDDADRRPERDTQAIVLGLLDSRKVRAAATGDKEHD